MSRPVSDPFRRAVDRPETDEVLITLVTVDHPDLAGGPLRLSSDEVDTVSRGETYVARAFSILPPDDVDGRQRPARFSVPVVRAPGGAGDPVAVLRQIETPPTITIELVLASQPDVVDVSWPNLELTDFDVEAEILSGSLRRKQVAGVGVPYKRFTPALVPGLFR